MMDRRTGPPRSSEAFVIHAFGWCVRRMPACRRRGIAERMTNPHGVACSPPPLAGGGRGEGGLPSSSSTPRLARPGWAVATCRGPRRLAGRRRSQRRLSFVDTGTIHRPPSGDILQRLLVRNLFANGGHLLVRSEAIRAAGGFLPGIAYGEDWEFWIRIALRGPFVAGTRSRAGGVRPPALGRRVSSPRRDPAAFTPCMDAIFANPALLARFGPRRLAAIRRRTDAENHWIIGRELIRHGHGQGGLPAAPARCAAHPRQTRCAACRRTYTAAAPSALRGPFRPYQFTSQAARTRTNFACSVPTSPCGRKMMNTTSRLP